jgi:hypothetical protein
MIQNTKGHPQVSIGLERLNFSVHGLNVKMRRLIEINLVPVNGLPLKNRQGLVHHFIGIHPCPLSNQNGLP